jgi:small subunit ribosomal protein S12
MVLLKSYKFMFPLFLFYYTNIMPTIQQLVRSARQKMTNKTKAPALKSCPQRRGVCTRVYTNPKKTKLSLQSCSCTSNNRVCRNCLYSRNWPHLQEHSVVLVRGSCERLAWGKISYRSRILDTAGVKVDQKPFKIWC